MKKSRLMAFIGKPGAGKTTLIRSAFPNKTVVDILPFHKKFWLPGGNIQENKLILAYQKMYEHVNALSAPLIILELGTNYPEFNIMMLENLQKNFTVSIYLCIASETTCWKRASERGMEHSAEAFKLRMARDFPESHRKLLTTSTLSYQTLNMEESLEKIITNLTK